MSHSVIKVHKATHAQPLRTVQPFTHHVLEKLRSELDRAFERYASHYGRPSLHRIFGLEGRLRHRMPLSSIDGAVDVNEEDRLFRISVELPGIEAKDIELTVSEDTLAIKGEKKHEREEETQSYYLREREFGSFERSIEIPAGVDYENIKAEFANGVLTIVMPKTPEAVRKHKKISIKSD